MRANTRKAALIGILLAIMETLSTAPSAMAEEKKNWAVTVYGAVQTRSDLWGTFYNPDFDSSYHFLAVAISRRVWSLTRHIDWEVEGQAVKHFGDQNHWSSTPFFWPGGAPFPGILTSTRASPSATAFLRNPDPADRGDPA